MPISNVSGSNFTTLYSSYQGNTSPYVPIPPSNSNVSGQNYTTLYSAGSGTAPVPIATYGNANVESFLAVGSDTGGNVVGNILSTGLISATGNIITDQYFIGTLLGNITGNFVVPGLNTQVIYNNNGNAAASSGLTFVAASNTLTSGGVVSAVGNVRGGNLTTVGQVSATGNVTGNYFIGNGSQLTGLPATYGNANVSNFLASGNNTSNIITTANIAGTYILGNGSQLTGLPATYSNANVTTLLANFGSNVISTTGNITAGYFIGNGSALTSITAANITGTVANATYALNANAATYATNAVQANVANVANSVAGANVSGTVANATYALNSNAATFAGTVTTAAQPNITSVGILTVINTSGNISATGNITGNVFSGNGAGLTNINAANIIGGYGNANVAANLAAFANNPISTSGNITAGYFIGNGSALTSLTGANVTGVVANATYAVNANAATYATDAVQANYANIANSVAGANVSGTVANATYALTSNAATFAGTVIDAAQPNITSVGILTVINTSGNISATGNITGNVFIGNGAGLTNINAANIIGAYGNANVAANLAAFANNPISTSGNITAGYFIGNGSALSDIAGANVTGTVGLAQYVTQNAQANITSVGILTSLSVSGNITTGNLTTAGNVTADYFIGNIAGNVSGNSISVSGNITGGNLLTNGQVSAAGNITGNYIIGNGSLLTSLTGANVTGTVDLAQYVTQNAQANITSVGTLTSLSVSGNVTAGNVVTSGTGLLVGNVFSEVVAGTTAAVLTARMAADDTFRIAVGGTTDAGFVELATADGGTEPIYVRQYQFSGPDPFGSLVRSLTLLDGAGNTSLPGNISVVGNINGANLNISNDALILGNLTVNGNTTFINSNVVTINDKFINLANNAANASAANGGGIGIGPIASEYATLTYDYLANVWTTNIGISVTGNITGNVFLGNGSGLTSLTGANVTGTVANATYALNANAATFAGTVTTNAQPNITSVGILTAVNTSGDISATGNITGNVFSGNGYGLTNINAANIINAYGNANVANFLGNGFGSNTITTTGNITSGNSTVTTTLYASNIEGAAGQTVTITAEGTGDIHLDADSIRIGDNNTAATIVTHGTGNLILRTHEGDANQGNITLVNGANGNIQLNPNGTGVVTTTAVSVTGNVTAGNITNNGTITSTGNITAPWFIGNVQGNIVGNVDAGGANTQVQFNDSDILNGTAGFTFDKTSNAVAITGNITSANVNTAGLITATGNVSGNNINATANIGSTQQTIVIGSNAISNIGNLNNAGNIILSGKNIATDVAFAPDISNTTTPTGGRVLIGSGVAGNTSILAYDPTNILRGSRVAIMDSYTKNTSGVVSGQLSTWAAVALDGNITTNAARVHGISSFVAVSGGAAGNSFITAGGGAINNGLNALSGVLHLGGVPSVAGGSASNLVPVIGANITTRYATSTSGILQFNGNGTVVGNGYGHIASMFNNATGNISIANVAAYGATFVDLVTTTANVGNTIGYLFPDTSSQLFGLQALSQSFQRSGNIYAFMNAGNLAQVRLGSTREQHYYAFPVTPVAGNVTVDAAKGKVQTLTLTGNVSVTDFTNFVTSAYNFGTAQDIPQQDDVTLIIQQPTSGPTYTVTLPTTVNSGASPVQYQNGVTAVNQDNLGRTYVNIRSQPNNMGGFPYYVAIESTAGSLPAAGADGQVQFNDNNVLGAQSNFTYNKTSALFAAGNIIAYNGTANVWGDINAANIYTQPGGQVVANSINGLTQVTTPQLYANAITDGGFFGTGNIQVNAANVNATGNINVSSAFYANIITAGAYVSTPALFTSDLTPPGGGPLQTTTTLSTISGNLSVTGTITGTGNITGGNLRTAGQVSATGNVIGGNITTTGIVSATGNVTGGNLTTTGTSILGSIRSYSQSQYSLGTSGTINIDKTNGQVQYLAPTGNVTIGSLQNFITTASTGNQADTVTLVIKQGATPYTVTMPTGNAAIKYASGITSVGTTANSVTMISITGANVASAAMYMLTISPEFS